MAEDPFDLGRFIDAQDSGGTYRLALTELGRGQKTSHWMWFVFPQPAGLGHSAMSRRYAIASLGEARAYLAHRMLGPRLLECATTVASSAAPTAAAIFGDLDAMKLHSSMTLFHIADPDEVAFVAVLDRYYAGAIDPLAERIV